MKQFLQKFGSQKMWVLLVALLASGAVVVAQETDDDDALGVPHLPASSYQYANVTLPPHLNTPQLRQFDNTPAGNPVTNVGATLGRVLFYDKRLSANHTISCASCHVQANGFGDPEQLSIGFEGGRTGRNSPALANGRFYENGRFFWDERADSLEDQVLMPIQDALEMGLTLEEMVNRIEAEAYYAPLFTDAFGTPDVTPERVSLAMAQFIRSMVSYQSKYDEGVATNFANFTNQENRGRQIFSGRGNCNDCHTTNAFVLEEAKNVGLDATTTDPGLAATTGNPADEGKFKVASLRNVAFSGPYMHDGRFATLEEVVGFYSNDVQPHPNLAPELRQGGPNGQPRRLNLNANDRAALVAFLETLTDDAFLTDPKFSDPFRTAVTFDEAVYLPIVRR
ncbi:MAG: cytochrome c peroxidase [Chloroflexota bacterium]